MLNAPTTTYLRNYKKPPYAIETVDLYFDIHESSTTVTSRFDVIKMTPDNEPLILDGKELELKSIAIDGVELYPADYKITENELIIHRLPERCLLELQVEIKPQLNTSLNGLYQSNNMYCTQCEAEGFRKITYFLDRPDVMSRYTVSIVADKQSFPVLLSNGNLVDSGEAKDNRHWVKWQDPFKKPCYLFALVAGDLAMVEDEFITRSGRTVVLRIFVEKGNEDKCAHAMRSLQKAMRWDEEVFGLEYDLDIFMIVAVSHFNMGAMENKGLNIFNSQYILADAKTATDDDYHAIESVIGHEYFHNWSGNRVTCRDWFQLSLKEGLTIFRDQEFSADMSSRAVSRIHDVRALRGRQFLEDSGPMSHPVRPDSYIEINNFYTMTIYNKGAELIRMMRSVLGAKDFYRAMSLYFQRHDGEAVTTEDFVKALEDSAGVDLTQFKLWYSQSGTPRLRVTSDYDATKQTYTLTFSQHTPATSDQSDKKPLNIPLALGLLDGTGNDMPLLLQGEDSSSHSTTRVLQVKNSQEIFEFIHVTEKPVASVLRGFSAPVILQADYSDEDLLFLLAHDSDGFNRWEAGQRYITKTLLGLISDYQKNLPLELDKKVVATFRSMLQGSKLEPDLLAQLLILPDEAYLGEMQPEIDVVATHEVRKFVKTELAKQLQELFLQLYHQHTKNKAYQFEPHDVASRSLKNLCLNYMMMVDNAATRQLCMQQFNSADNMTDVMASLGALNNTYCPERVEALAAFYDQWQHEPLVVNKWLGLHAQSELADTLNQIKILVNQPFFDIKNPNQVRAVLGVFSHRNHIRFHDKSGEGYEFLTDYVLQLDKLNPQISARMVEPLIHWRRYDKHRQTLMQVQLQRVLKQADLSNDVYEIVSKSIKQ